MAQKRTNYNTKKRTATQNGKRNQRKSEPMDVAIKSEVILIALFALAIFLFLCNFHILGVTGDAISNVMFGIFGLTAYLIPIFFFVMIAFAMINSGNVIATRKIVAAVGLYFIVGIACDLFTGAPQNAEGYDVQAIYTNCSQHRYGGGVLSGSLAYLANHFLGLFGTVLTLLVIAIIALIVITDKSFVNGVKHGGQKVYERSREDAAYRRERAMQRREEMEERNRRREEERRAREEERRIREEQKEDQKILRMDKKVTGVMIDTSLTKENVEEPTTKVRDDIHEINLADFDKLLEHPETEEQLHEEELYDIGGSDELEEISESYEEEEIIPDLDTAYQEPPREIHKIERNVAPAAPQKREPAASTGMETHGSGKPQKYIFPPIRLLAEPPKKGKKDATGELRETAQRLQQTLQTFGVKVTITDISQGPAVTRYELQPEQGVKVSKIVGLTDDIKLNLAATDIRIEAPIPGKAAIGIEVPNKENSAVGLRELLETKEFKEFPSKIAFAVGKDISGKVVVADIGKMPHMLIAGATGSGKSVCINTLIMSILYKAHPDEVKLIMIDPKVVELSVYNGIPHLLIPVVTDPKKASAALQWGVAEMTDRYQKFADFNVRDLKGYNKKVETMIANGESQPPAKMPQIVIIVDELADLMMVAPGEVEESICRLAQLARAAGIHLIIATQRPSVDVITGLIKANMPSRVAFSVSSGVDSRTILDMNGAEKLLGKGDMLFYPQGYTKPARVQGAFVSDKEVSDVVEFLKNQKLGNIYDSDIQDKMENLSVSQSEAHGGGTANERDQYFVDAAKFIIEKDKASIGMLQRVFKIGFNRAARIMDQLCEAGVVGEEEGTKPRKVLMSEEQLEQYIDEFL